MITATLFKEAAAPTEYVGPGVLPIDPAAPLKTCPLDELPTIYQGIGVAPNQRTLDQMSWYKIVLTKDGQPVYTMRFQPAGSCCGGQVINLTNEGLNDAEQQDVWKQLHELMTKTRKSLLFITGYFTKKEFTEIFPHYQLSQVTL